MNSMLKVFENTDDNVKILHLKNKFIVWKEIVKNICCFHTLCTIIYVWKRRKSM